MIEEHVRHLHLATRVTLVKTEFYGEGLALKAELLVPPYLQ